MVDRRERRMDCGQLPRSDERADGADVCGNFIINVTGYREWRREADVIKAENNKT